MKLYNIDYKEGKDAPEGMIKDRNALLEELIQAITPITQKYDPNIILSAINMLHAVIIKSLVVEDEEERKKAFINCCCALMRNVDYVVETTKKS